MVDKSLIGKESKPTTFKVEAKMIQDMAGGITDFNRYYFDEGFAKKSQFGGIVANPTIGFRIPTGMDLLQSANLNMMGILHGGMEFEYHKPMIAGMTLTCTPRVADVYDKEGRSGGYMEFYVTETVCVDETGDKVLTIRSTMIQRRKKKPS